MPIDEGRLLDSKLVDIVEGIFLLIKSSDKIILNININSLAVAGCLLIRVGILKQEAIDILNKKILGFSSEEVPSKQILRYKKPLNVIFCGDRNTCTCFEEQIIMELKNLPKYSLVIHGGCKGVDLYTEELATTENIKTLQMDADWSLGPKAGAIRNGEMLAVEGGIDMVLAFHPDIQMSKGTKNMMTQAHQKGIPVYIHDMKRKMKFEGDFDVL
ncbi:MAG TPA: hypothetical protein PKD85_08970 [Saprospiraceae bacterium]|nr:hypothetical protein [Saprospiraceae bacterium]